MPCKLERSLVFKDELLVQAALSQRNEFLAEFWLSEANVRSRIDPTLLGKRAVVVDAGDDFTKMLAQQLSAIGLEVNIRKFNETNLLNGTEDLVVMGPGPGNPSNLSDPRIACIRKTLAQLLLEQRPFFAVCLSHQALCLELGLKLFQKNPPNQGTQCEIDLFGTPERVGFYNTYVALCDQVSAKTFYDNLIEVSRDLESNEVYALRCPHFASIQFHAESLLTRNGIRIIASSIKKVLGL
jgi:phenazine biosynthesis protein phzE